MAPNQILLALFALSTVCYSFGNCQEHALLDTTTIDDYEQLPIGIIVYHDSNPVAAVKGVPNGRMRAYTWNFKTTVSTIETELRIVEFGAHSWVDGEWRLLQPSFSRQQFAEWYGCKDSLIVPDKTYADPKNWQTSNNLNAFLSRWYFIGEDAKGNRFRGDAVIYAKAKLAN
jgi:hypothetical protein